MRPYALLASLAVCAVQSAFAEDAPQGFAPACSTAACPHPVTAVYPAEPQLVGPHLLPPALNPVGVVPAPVALRDFEVRVASNEVVSAQAADKSELLKAKLRDVARLQYEIQQLRTELGQNQQILVKVTMLDVSLTKLRKLGIDIGSASDGKLNVMDIAGLQKAIESSTQAAAGQQLDSQDRANSVPFVHWLLENCIGKVLADPSLIVVSGRPAQFFCGSELPVPSGGGAGRAVEFQRCGTEIDVVAVSTNDNRVRLELRARVSERDDRHSLRVDDSSIPALRVRECDTAVETKFGQPVVLNGMIEKRVVTIKTDGVEHEEVNDIALMLIVTPELLAEPASSENGVSAIHAK